MFEKLLSLLLHGKGALVAGVLVAGSAGAVISGTVNGVDFNLTVAPAASSSPATSPAASPLANAPLLSQSSPTNTTSTSGDTASNCSDAAHLRNDANLAARVVWTQGRAALELLVKAAKVAGDDEDADKVSAKDAKKAVASAKKAIEEARKVAQNGINGEWKLVACAGKAQDADSEDTDEDDTDGDSTSTTTDSTTSTTTPTTTTTTTTTTPTTTTTTPTTTDETTTNTVEISFDTADLGRYAKFIDDEVTAVNEALSDAASSIDTTTVSSEKKDHEKKLDKKTSSKKHGHGRGHHEADDN